MESRARFGAGFASFFASIMKEFEPRYRHVGDGAKRAAIRLKRHREQQAARVAPALMAIDAKRWLLADSRVERWIRKGRDLDKAPGHIQAMARQVGMRS